MTPPELKMHPDHIKLVKRFGFTYAVVVERSISVRVPGSVEALFRSHSDAKRFVVALDRIYGKGCYGVRSL